MKKLLVVGCGSIGRRHIVNFRAAGVDYIAGVDQRPDRLEQARVEAGIDDAYENITAALAAERFDAAAITTPPHLHVELAKAAALEGCHLFIEKPLAHNMNGLDELAEICNRKNLVCLVAYCYRFIPYVKKMREILDSGRIGKVFSARLKISSYLPDWHPWEDYRTFYMAKNEEGGGALLDESHGIDLLRWLFGEVTSVSALVDRVSELEINCDDLAVQILRFNSGVVAETHFDLLGRIPRVRMELIGSKGTLIWDRIEHTVSVYEAEHKRWSVYPYSLADYLKMYPLEVAHFLSCVRDGQAPLISLEDARKTLEVLLASFESAHSARQVQLSS
jgi:predicted dehydrogenase